MCVHVCVCSQLDPTHSQTCTDEQYSSGVGRPSHIVTQLWRDVVSLATVITRCDFWVLRIGLGPWKVQKWIFFPFKERIKYGLATQYAKKYKLAHALSRHRRWRNKPVCFTVMKIMASHTHTRAHTLARIPIFPSVLPWMQYSAAWQSHRYIRECNKCRGILPILPGTKRFGIQSPVCNAQITEF